MTVSAAFRTSKLRNELNCKSRWEHDCEQTFEQEFEQEFESEFECSRGYPRFSRVWPGLRFELIDVMPVAERAKMTVATSFIESIHQSEHV